VSILPYPPDDEAEVDREIRIEKMKREFDELAGGTMISGGFGEVPPAIEDAFLACACRFEKTELDTNFNRLIRHGLALEPPDELDDATLAARLAEMLRVLGTMRCFVECTDHLSDRELYAWLWAEGLREETPSVLQLGGGTWHTSPIGRCEEEETMIFLKYYASDEERRRWQEQFPNDTLPPHQRLP